MLSLYFNMIDFNAGNKYKGTTCEPILRTGKCEPLKTKVIKINNKLLSNINYILSSSQYLNIDKKYSTQNVLTYKETVIQNIALKIFGKYFQVCSQLFPSLRSCIAVNCHLLPVIALHASENQNFGTPSTPTIMNYWTEETHPVWNMKTHHFAPSLQLTKTIFDNLTSKFICTENIIIDESNFLSWILTWKRGLQWNECDIANTQNLVLSYSCSFFTHKFVHGVEGDQEAVRGNCQVCIPPKSTTDTVLVEG